MQYVSPFMQAMLHTTGGCGGGEDGVGDWDGEGMCDGDSDGEGECEGDGDGDGMCDGDGDGEGECEGDGEGDGMCDGDGDGKGEWEGEGEGDGMCDGDGDDEGEGEGDGTCDGDGDGDGGRGGTAITGGGLTGQHAHCPFTVQWASPNMHMAVQTTDANQRCTVAGETTVMPATFAKFAGTRALIADAAA